jgi:hypothetical protein
MVGFILFKAGGYIAPALPLMDIKAARRFNPG